MPIPTLAALRPPASALLALVVVATGLHGPELQAQGVRRLALDGGGSYPAKTIRMIVPYPAGASTDSVARILASGVGEVLGQTILVDNRAGAAGTIGTDVAARANPDGHTWLLATANVLTINPNLYRDTGLEPGTRMVPVALVAEVPNVLVVHPGLPVRTLEELVRYARRRPGELAYGSAGPGSSIHLGTELFKAMTGTLLLHVPYRGGAPAVTALIGGHVQLMFNSVPLALPHLMSGKLVGLAVTAPERAELLPEVPTMREAGLDAFEFMNWYALLLPPRTPRRIARWLDGEIAAVLGTGPVRKRLAAIGATSGAGHADRLADLIRKDTVRWSQVMDEAGIRLEWTRATP